MSDRLTILNVLLVEDRPRDIEWITGLLRNYGVGSVTNASNAREAREILGKKVCNCAIVDIELGLEPEDRTAGFDVLESEEGNDIYKIVLTHEPSHHESAIVKGARRFLTKSDVLDDSERLKVSLIDASLYVQDHLDVIYQSQTMVRLFREVAAIARADSSVLILGESGSGKEVVAKVIHALSPRANGPFEVINCACLEPNSVGGELFGIEEKGFTGARSRAGVFERANHGHVFLDEIGDLAPSLQSQLFQVLQNPQWLRRSGAETPVQINKMPVDFRLICATDQDLTSEKFRHQLFERIAPHVIKVPSLDERKEDIPILVNYDLRMRREKPSRVSTEAMKVFVERSWKGSNVRGLRNTLNAALLQAELRENSASAVVTGRDVEEVLRNRPAMVREVPESIEERLRSGTVSLEEGERYLVRRALEANAWTVSKASETLGIGRNTLYEKMKRYGIQPPDSELGAK